MMDNNYNIGYTKHMQSMKWYNPNRFNPLDSALVYLITLVLFFTMPFAFRYIFLGLRAIGILDIYVLLCISAILSQGMILGIALVYSKVLKVDAYNGGGFKSSTKTVTALMSAILIIGMLILFVPVTENFIESIYKLGGFRNTIQYEGNEMVYLFYVFVLTTILPAICEELLFRGVVLKGLLPYGKTFAIVMSSLMFAIMHGSFQQLIYQFLVGLAIGTVVVMTKSILLGMIMHFTNNLFASIYAIVIGVSGNFMKNSAIHITTVVFVFLGIVCFVAGIVYFAKYAFNVYKKELLKEKTETNVKSCLSYDRTFENASYINYDEPIRYSTTEEDVNFYHNKKGFIPMRKKVKNNSFVVFLLCFDIVFAIFIILNDYFAII